MSLFFRFIKVFLLLVCSLTLNLAVSGQQNRTFTGTGNNLASPEWGAVGTDQLTIVSNGYADGISTPAGADRPNPRVISNAIFSQSGSIPDPLNLSDYTWVFGQFIDHDITLSPEDEEAPINILVPLGDPNFDPNGLGTVVIPSFRSVYNHSGSSANDGRRTFPSEITAFVDGSAVYGSDETRANWLRTFVGGKLKMSLGDLLPYNTITGEFSGAIDTAAPEMAMANPTVELWFVAGDVRANENPMLTSIHTLFTREHNRQCDLLSESNSEWTDEEIYQYARKIVGGKIEAIVYEEWLPILGIDIGSYAGYDATVNPGIMNVFSTAAYRYGHTVIGEEILRLNNDGSELEEGNLELKDAFFNPSVILDSHGIDPLLKGMSRQVEQDLDSKMVDGLRNFLFGPPGAGGLDLASLNINRGRERGLPDYNTIRKDFGLVALNDFSEISSDTELNNLLSQVYGGDVNNIDPWVGFLSEDHMSNSLYTESIMTIVGRQFRALRDGDRYYFENDPALNKELKEEIKKTRLVDIIRNNSGTENLQDNVFIVEENQVVAEYRSYDGTGNNETSPEWGAVGTNQLSVVSNGYADGISSPGGDKRPNPRVISNEIFSQSGLIPDVRDLSDYAWVWGQFIDHDITLSPENTELPININVPSGDEYFDPNGTGNVVIPMSRSAFDPSSGLDASNPRAFPSEITAFIDASAVYGSSEERATWLRSFEGGKLRMSEGHLLPYNTLSGEFFDTIDGGAPEMAMANPNFEKWFVAGDVRANENPLLTSLHTVFAREHNRLCDVISDQNQSWNDEEIYQHARKLVGGYMEAIVYEEWLPTLGIEIPTYTGYDNNVNPGIMNVFSTAAYRYGHTVINSTILRMDDDGNTMPEGNLLLRDAFFNPDVVGKDGGVDPLIRGMATQIEQDFDCKMIDELRNFLFGPPGAGGLDLAAMNINRGRERGLPDYNSIRLDMGLGRVESFETLTSNPWFNQIVESVYGDIDEVDPWVGFLAEDHMPNTLFGETVKTILEEQFSAIRDGDRFYYKTDPALSVEEKADISQTRLSHIIMRNTDISGIQSNVFIAKSRALADLDSASISGEIVTSFGQLLEGANLTLDGITEITTSEDGRFSFNTASSQEHTIKATKNNDYLNGISTLDIVMIQRHALGIQLLDSPYKVIAADINGDQRISAIDVTQLAKLILGTWTEFPDSDSWRIIVKDQEFAEPRSPFPFVDELVVNLGTDNVVEQDFIATKIGDVSGNAKVNSLISSEVRNLNTLSFHIQDAVVQKGDLVHMHVKATDFNDISAYQFTLDMEGLEFVEVSSEAVKMTDSNVAILDRETMTAAWYNTSGISTSETLFSITFKALKQITLSESISMNSSVTPVAAYTSDAEQLGLELLFDPIEISEFTLYQNEPNPFIDETSISFDLPEAGIATLTVVDATGRVLVTKTEEFVKGRNVIQLNRAEISSSGILYYQIESGGYIENKKMLLVE